MAKPRTKAVGIDLGTTNSVIAVIEAGRPTVIPNAQRERITPSVVALLDKGNVLVGRQARRQAVLNPLRTIFSSKRFMGRRINEVEDEIHRVPYRVVGGPNGAARFDLGNGEVASPEEIGATIIRQLVEDASDYLHAPVKEAVITVPAYFNDAQRQATKNAGEIAGVTVLRILNEPTAAALAYGLDKRAKGKILVFDLGGGTFDVSVLNVHENVCEVLSTAGDTHLGGDDFDQCLIDWVAADFKREHKIDLRTDPQAWQRLSEALERAKCELSATTETTIDLPYIANDFRGPKHIQRRITRDEFQGLTEHLVKRCLTSVEQALADAHLAKQDIDDVLLVGGSTRMPAVRALVRDFMGREPNMGVSPDEVVALGAAVQAGIMKGEFDDLVLLDVTPFSLGVLTAGGKMEVMIERNSAIPTRESKLFSTASHFQRGVDVIVLQGEYRDAARNVELGRFPLDGITGHLKGEAEIEIIFDIDENGILEVSATDLGNGVTEKITITNTTNLNRKEIEGMVRNATAHAKRDKEEKLATELRQEVDYAIHRAERMLAEFNESASLEVNAIKSRCESILEHIRQAMAEEGSPRKLRKLKSSLDEALDDLDASHRANARQ